MRPIIFPVFLPNAGCRERCLFCNQKASGGEAVSPALLPEGVESFLATLPSDAKPREKQVAFYGGSFTAMGSADQIAYLGLLLPFLSSGQIDSIRVSTRPDALGDEDLHLLKRYGVKTVEVGAQSMNDEVLAHSRRGHTSEDTRLAVSRLKRSGFEVGIQLMTGLPEDHLGRFLQTLDQVIHLNPDFVRIHPTLVLKGAPLESLWKDGRYAPLSLDETIGWLKRGLPRLEKAKISVARVGLQPTKGLDDHVLAGPYHPAFRQLVESAIALEMARRLLQRHPNGPRARFLCHPGEISTLRGQRNENLIRLKGQFKLVDLAIQGCENVPRGTLLLKTSGAGVSISKGALLDDEA